MRPIIRVVLVLSLLLNAAGTLLAAWYVHHKGLHTVAVKLHLSHDPAIDYAALAADRFGALPGAAVEVYGDSQVQNAPLAELVGPVAQRGIGGQTVADCASWLGLVLDDRELRHLVVWAGTNDVLLGHSPDAVAADYGRLLDKVKAERPGVTVTVLTVPPIVGKTGAVRAVNAALARVAGEKGATIVDLTGVLAGSDGQYQPRYTEDGTHLTALGYRTIQPLLRRATGQAAG